MVIKKINNINSDELATIVRNFRKDNKIYYDYKLYKIYDKDNYIGSLIEYDIPIKNCLYFDIHIFADKRRQGFGSKILNIYKEKNKNKDLFIRSNQESKNNFLKKNGFNIVQDNLNKNLYYLDNSL